MVDRESLVSKVGARLHRAKTALSAILLEWKAATFGEKLIDLGTCIAAGVLLAYLISMVVLPWFEGGFDWGYVQGIWHSWQTLNVGMIALGSSLLAFYSARYNSRQQRKYEHIAAVSFLSRASSELIGYFEESARLLNEAYGNAEGPARRASLNNSVPALPYGYEEVFYKCIVGADNDLASYLSSILSKLQVHHSRIGSLSSEFSPDSTYNVTKRNIVSYILCLAELHALVSRLFDYARHGKRSYRVPLTKGDYDTACLNLKLYSGEIEELSKAIDMRVGTYDGKQP